MVLVMEIIEYVAKAEVIAGQGIPRLTSPECTHTHTDTQDWKITEPNIHKISLRNIIKRKYGWYHFLPAYACLQWTCIIGKNIKMFCKNKIYPSGTLVYLQIVWNFDILYHDWVTDPARWGTDVGPNYCRTQQILLELDKFPYSICLPFIF